MQTDGSGIQGRLECIMLHEKYVWMCLWRTRYVGLGARVYVCVEMNMNCAEAQLLLASLHF